MNLPGPPQFGHFDYRGHAVTSEFAADGEQLAVRADVQCNGRFVGRVTLCTHPGDEAALRDRLDRRVRALIDEWMQKAAARAPADS